tara:strand:+ start:496 stop:1065 length:570 start_codon:yes stop_codon:yes gene_type:complete
MSEENIEKEIQAKNLNAPRLTPALIDATVKEKTFHVFGDTCLTVCCLTLANGFTVTGESACASPENFNAEIGEKIAFEQARNKVWMLEGYLLKQNIFHTSGEMSFGMAIEAAKRGCKVGRIGWNGSGMFAYIVPAAKYKAQTSVMMDMAFDNDLIPYREYWALFTAQKDVATWSPSGSDSLANDWVIVK